MAAQIQERLRNDDLFMEQRNDVVMHFNKVMSFAHVVELRLKLLLNLLHGWHVLRHRKRAEVLDSLDICSKLALNVRCLDLHCDLLASVPKLGAVNLPNRCTSTWHGVELREYLSKRLAQAFLNNCLGLSWGKLSGGLVLHLFAPLKILRWQKVVCSANNLAHLEIKSTLLQNRIPNHRCVLVVQLVVRFVLRFIVQAFHFVLDEQVMRINRQHHTPKHKLSTRSLITLCLYCKCHSTNYAGDSKASQNAKEHSSRLRDRSSCGRARARSGSSSSGVRQ
mmetsp:Transcript_15916/g.30809  ORF Transcript_15916/g.30809 Transcript_15916/m.30809 type:complete len:279 (-) Transcript_15916:248-1084(-)